MSNTLLDNAKYGVLNLIPYDNRELRERFDALMEEVAAVNVNNMKAFIPVGDLDEKEVDISDYEISDDYDVDTYDRVDEDGDRFSSEEEYEKHIRRKIQGSYKFEKGWLVDGDPDDKLYKTKEDALIAKDLLVSNEEIDDDAEIKEIIRMFIDDDAEEDRDADDSNSEPSEWIEEIVEDKLGDWDNLERQEDEIMWNTVFQFRGDANPETAAKCNLGVLTFRRGEHEDESYLFLTGCGMDLSPLIVAYQALEFGYIDEKYIYKLESDPKYFKYVTGMDVYFEMMKALKLERFIAEEDLEQYQQWMKERESNGSSTEV